MRLGQVLAMVVGVGMLGACMPASAPPATESESGSVVNQAITVGSFVVDVTDDGSAVFVVSGSVPSACHEATFGFEEPNETGIMVGASETWLDPDCDPSGGPVEFTESMVVSGLPSGEYTAELDSEFESSFVIADPTPTAPPPTEPTEIEARDLELFSPLGDQNCEPPSPFLAWPDDAGTLAEVSATSDRIEVWGLLWEPPPLLVGAEIKMVWRVTGDGAFDIRAHRGDLETAPTFGPSLHLDSTYQRPGDEWGTAFIFPEPGCWEIEMTRGRDVARVWIEVDS